MIKKMSVYHFLLIIYLALADRLNYIEEPNHCFRCDFHVSKKVKICPSIEFNIRGLEIIKCGYEKPICGITLNVTDKIEVIYAGCYSKKYKKYCFKDQVKQYGPINTSYCYHTCDGFLCNPYNSWNEETSNKFINWLRLDFLG